MVIHAFPLFLVLAALSGYHLAYWLKQFPAIWARRGFWFIGRFLLGINALYLAVLVIHSASEWPSWALLGGFLLRFLQRDVQDNR